MKTKYLFFAAIAGLTLASCADDVFVGDNSPTVVEETTVEEGAIRFGSGFKAITRANHVGADAANLLDKKFYVVAFHGNGSSSMTQTFDNYLVTWSENTAGKTESNTSDWEYVGNTAPAWSGIAGNTQTIKYWDYTYDQYDFIAWSPGTATVVSGSTDPSGDSQVKITKPVAGSYSPSYTLEGTRLALAKCYIADMVTAYKADKTPIQPKYQEEVKFTFRNLACKVRMAIYETVPGYSVKDVKFYVDDATTDIATGATLTNAHLFTSGSETTDYFFKKGTYTVAFDTKGSANLSATDYNKAHVTFAAAATDGSDTKEDFGTLNFVGKETSEADGNYIGRSLPNASYAGDAPYYKTMLPNETGTVLELRVDYTLVPTDGASESIKIHGAKAFVPLIYAQWRPNYAYTYIFKISDNTNGWTSTVTDDPQGLFPITFDAIVVDAEEHQQNTITTVAYPSITTYQKGHNPLIDGSKIGIDEYDKDNGDIYVQVMKDGTLANNLNGSNISKLYTLSGKSSYTEADVLDALNVQASVSGSNITGRNDVVLTNVDIDNTITTIPGVNGNNITVTGGTAAKFTPSENTYAYVYDTETYGGQKYTAQPAGWPTGYYDNAACTTPSSTFTANTVYYKKQSFISSYVELTAKPADWKADDTNPYYSDEACQTQITSAYANPAGASYTTQPADWPMNYYVDSSFNTQATTFASGTTYYRKYACYRKYNVDNKLYGVKVIKVVD